VRVSLGDRCELQSVPARRRGGHESAGAGRHGGFERLLVAEPLLSHPLVLLPGNFLPAWLEAELSERGELDRKVERAKQRARDAGGGEHVFGKVGMGSDGKVAPGGCGEVARPAPEGGCGLVGEAGAAYGEAVVGWLGRLARVRGRRLGLPWEAGARAQAAVGLAVGGRRACASGGWACRGRAARVRKRRLGLPGRLARVRERRLGLPGRLARVRERRLGLPWEAGAPAQGRAARMRHARPPGRLPRGMSARYTYRLRVRYGECDQQGVVFNAHYFAYFDHTLTEAWRDVVVPYQEMLKAGVDLVVAEAKARFRAPARFEDELDLVWWVTRLGNTAMTTRIDVMRGEELLVEGELRHVFVDAGTNRKRPIPHGIRAALEAYLEDGAALA
jgi:acyl-CoA thioester hydrolase